MDRKKVLLMTLIFVLVSTQGAAVKVQKAEASVAIYIKADGSVVGTDKIQRVGDTYIFVSDINGSIAIEKSNLIVDGNRYTLQGSGNGEGFCLYNINNVTIKNTIIKGFDYGVHLNLTSFCSFLENNITENNYDGIRLSNSSSNRITENNITRNNQKGIVLIYSLNNAIFANNITANEWGGIFLHNSLNNRVFGNDITDDQDGVWVGYSSNNSIVGNEIKKNTRGIVLYRGSSNNSVSGNNIRSNDIGFYLYLCSCNKLYHNNLMDNTKQAESSNSTNTWDDGYPSGGNNWSDYDRTDLLSGIDQNISGSDGIVDVPHIIDDDNIDQYPLIAHFNTFDAGTWNSVTYNIDIISNSTLSNFYFNPEEAYVRFNVTGQNGHVGSCRVTIPKELLWVQNGWTIYVESQTANYTIIPDENYTYIYFTYNHSIKMVRIQGTHAIPEFSSFLVLPLFIIATLSAVVIYRRKHSMQLHTFLSSDKKKKG